MQDGWAATLPTEAGRAKAARLLGGYLKVHGSFFIQAIRAKGRGAKAAE